MFKILGPNSAESSDGFKVERIGRNEIKYTEGVRSVIVEVEPGDGLAIYTSSITAWTVGGTAEPIHREDADRIIKNVCEALDFLQTPYVVE